MAIADLINCTPEALAETTPLSDLMESIRKIDQWDDRHAEVLDYIYKHRLVRLIRTVKRGEGAAVELEELYEHEAIPSSYNIKYTIYNIQFQRPGFRNLREFHNAIFLKWKMLKGPSENEVQRCWQKL